MGDRCDRELGESDCCNALSTIQGAFLNYDTNTLVGAQHVVPLREIYMYQGYSEMVLAYGVTHTISTDFRNGKGNHLQLISEERHYYQNNALKTQSSNHQ